MVSLIVASIAFVGSHFLLSHPLRRPLVARLGEQGFLGLYSLVAFATLGWMAHAFAAVPPEAPWWVAGDLGWGIATLVMLAASILFVGSLFGNPAFPTPAGGGHEAPARARGVYAVTRHPMMWAFALWALVHMAVLPTAANLVLTAAILVLALVGAALQDAKKAALQPDRWPDWERRTSYWPFAAQLAGRAPATIGDARAILGGAVLWLAASWAHIPLAAMPAGIWRWIS